MKLEVGMYVRTIGGIERLKKENDNGWFFEKSMIIKPDNIEKYIIKASYNIIDILEVGDYVNGSPISSFKTYEKDRIWIYTDSNYKCGYLENEIKTIVTHEQMEQMAYKVGE